MVTLEQRRVLSAMALCRTAALGGHLDVCRSCPLKHPSYNSCRNRHCPKCQALAQERWIAARGEKLLPVGHFHAVFTVPSELRPLAQKAPRVVYDALFQAASATLQELAHTRGKATLGITLVLHTLTRELHHHPHVHAIVSTGAHRVRLEVDQPQVSLPRGGDGNGVLRQDADPPARGAQRHSAGKLPGTSAELERLLRQLKQHNWVVHVKKAFRHAEHVLKYLGRYTHRVAISNSRFVAITQQAVTFRTKEGKATTLPPTEFLRRFLQHVLPKGFQKIRHYGLYASAAEAHLQRARLPAVLGLRASAHQHRTTSILARRTPSSHRTRSIGMPKLRRPTRTPAARSRSAGTTAGRSWCVTRSCWSPSLVVSRTRSGIALSSNQN